MINRLVLASIAFLCASTAAGGQAAVAFNSAAVLKTGLAEGNSAVSTSAIPEAPTPSIATEDQTPSSGTAAPQNQPSKRILGIVPNYRAVRVGANLPPQTVRQKFITAGQDTIDPASFALSGLVAAVNYGRNNTPEFHTGGVAFGRYYWHALADQSVENLTVEFLVPALTHEDTRYYTLGAGGARKRVVYSLTRILIVRSDSGKETFNIGEVGGAGIAAIVSSRYYPPSQKTVGSVIGQYGLSLGIDAGSYVLREFDSDLVNILSRKHGHANGSTTP